MTENETNTIANESEAAESKAETQEQQNPLGEKSETKGKTFTQEELNKAISARLSQEKEKHEKILAEKLSEAEKLAKMNAEQKTAYEKEQREKQLTEREANITRRELEAEAKSMLAEKGLPLELAECVSYTDAGSCKKSLEAVEKAFAGAVEKKVNEKLKQNPPGKAGGETQKDPFIEGLGL